MFDLHVLNLFIFWLPVAPLEYSFLKRLLSSANLRPMGGGTTAEDRSEIALFKVKKKFPFQGENSILEFTSILVCPKKLVELRNYPLGWCNAICLQKLLMTFTIFSKVKTSHFLLLISLILCGVCFTFFSRYFCVDSLMCV